MSQEENPSEDLQTLIEEYNKLSTATTKISYTKRRSILLRVAKECKSLRKELLEQRNAIPKRTKKIV